MEQNNKLSYRTLKYYFNEKLTSKTKNLRMLKFDDVSYYSLTTYKYSNKIIDVITKYIDPKNSFVIDACACIGGDTINFCQVFNYVIAVELDKTRYDYLVNNISYFNIYNCSTLNNDCNDIINLSYVNCVYFDLPWNGKDYKKQEKMELYLGDKTLPELCLKYKENAYIFCLKVPNNYDIKNMENVFNGKMKVDVFNLRKFKVLIVQKQN